VCVCKRERERERERERKREEERDNIGHFARLIEVFLCRRVVSLCLKSTFISRWMSMQVAEISID
jgi:hypothetical protein